MKNAGEHARRVQRREAGVLGPPRGDQPLHVRLGQCASFGERCDFLEVQEVDVVGALDHPSAAQALRLLQPRPLR